MPKSVEHETAPKRGRPHTSLLDDRRRIAEVIRQYGACGARRQLDGTIWMSTVLRIAPNFEIDLRRGRRRAA